MRKYLPIGKSFYLFGNAMLSAVSVRNTSLAAPQSGFYKQKAYSINAMVVPGITYQVNMHLFLEAALNNLLTIGYERSNIETQDGNGNNTKGVTNFFNLSSGIGSSAPLQVGVRWMIVRK